MFTPQLTAPMRRLVEDLKQRRQRKRAAAARGRAIDCMELEDRILLSASPLAAESLVNETIIDSQQTAAQSPQTVAADASGNHVIVWSSQNQDGDGWGVYARRFDADGVAQGDEFQVNSEAANDQQDAKVAMNADGSFVITWTDSSRTPGSADVYARSYNADGVAQGDQFQVNTTTNDDQMYSAAAMDAEGNFVIVWSSRNQDGDGWGIYGQRYDASGNPLGSEFRVNTTTGSDQMHSQVAMDANGDFTVVWQSQAQDGNGWEIHARRFGADGVAQGDEFQVNSTSAGDQQHAGVGMNAGGDFVVSWSSEGQDGSGQGVFAQRYHSDGSTAGGEFQVNTTTSGDQDYSSVVMDDSGAFLITWSSYNQDAPGTWGIYGQAYTTEGIADGSEISVNTTTAGSQASSSAATLRSGHYIVAWSGNGVGDDLGVFSSVVWINETPVNTVPSTQSVREDEVLTFSTRLGNAISISDPDADDSAVQVTLTVDHGQLSLGSTAGLTFSEGDGIGDSTMTMVGTVNEINTALDGLQFNPVDNYGGIASLEITTNDLGNTGAGDSRSTSDTVSIRVTAVNDAPAIVLPEQQNVYEHEAVVFSLAEGNAIGITDQDAADIPVQVTLGTGQGYLSLSSTERLIFGCGDGIDDTTISFVGMLDDVNAALNGLQFTPIDNYSGLASIEIIVNDLGNVGQGGPKFAAGTVLVNVTAVNDPPVVTLPDMVGFGGTEITFSAANGNAIRVDDPDASESSPFLVTVMASDGLFNLASTTGLNILGGSPAQSTFIIIYGTLDNINHALDGLHLQTMSSNAALQLTVNDLGNTGAGGAKEVSETLYIHRSGDLGGAPGVGGAGFQSLQGVLTQPTVEALTEGALPEVEVQPIRAVLEHEQINVSTLMPRIHQNKTAYQDEAVVSEQTSERLLHHGKEKLSVAMHEAKNAKPLEEVQFSADTQGATKPMQQVAALQWDDSIMAGIGIVSAGTLAWAINGGSLLAGALSTTPMWKPFDPLAVLEFSDRGSKSGLLPMDDDGKLVGDENLQSLLS